MVAIKVRDRSNTPFLARPPNIRFPQKAAVRQDDLQDHLGLFPLGDLRRRAPAPPPFSSMTSTPAIASARPRLLLGPDAMFQ